MADLEREKVILDSEEMLDLIELARATGLNANDYFESDYQTVSMIPNGVLLKLIAKRLDIDLKKISRIYFAPCDQRKIDLIMRGMPMPMNIQMICDDLQSFMLKENEFLVLHRPTKRSETQCNNTSTSQSPQE